MAGDTVRGIGPMVRAWRERALLTQDELAERSLLSVRTIRRLERGAIGVRPRSASVRQLAEALGLHEEEQAALIAAVRSSSIPEPQVSTPVPPLRQLPAAPPQFTGRVADLARLERVADGTRTVMGIDGMAGVGKTHLALHAAHRWAQHYPDGQLFLDLQGCTRGAHPVRPGDAGGRLIHLLGVPDARIPDGLDDRAALYRSCLTGRRVLILLDNAAAEDQVAPLLPGSPGCLVLMTSRRRLNGLRAEAAHLGDRIPLRRATVLLGRIPLAGHAAGRPSSGCGVDAT
jgi:transcriptional regulator with XRE-family HTH domain